jgi:hypothetical protein
VNGIAIKERLLKLAGPDTALHARHKVYIDIVSRGLLTSATSIESNATIFSSRSPRSSSQDGSSESRERPSEEAAKVQTHVTPTR